MIDLSIVILTYNQIDLTRRTLMSVQKAMEKGKLSMQTIVTDNGSSEDIIGMVRSEFNWVEVVDNGENLGFSAGNNRGVARATGKYVLFLNSDTEIIGDVLSVLVSRMESDSEIGIASCKVELANGEIDPASHRGFPTPWRAMTYYSGLEKMLGGKLFGGYHLLDTRELNEAHEIDACTGAFLLMRRSLGEELGWWDEQFFMYGEDLDLCYRVKERGLKVMFYPDQKIIHYKHSSGLNINYNQTTDSQNQALASDHLARARNKRLEIKLRTTNAFYEAMKLFYLKHYPQKYPWYIQKIVFMGIDILKAKRLKVVKASIK